MRDILLSMVSPVYAYRARIERPPLYRGGSASKKDGCLPPRITLRRAPFCRATAWP